MRLVPYCIRRCLRETPWYGYVLVAVSFLVGVGLGYLFIAGSQRTDRIQASRIESCERTYEAFREVLTPFFRPAQVQTRQERRNVRKFNRTVRRLKAGCERQVKGEP